MLGLLVIIIVSWGILCLFEKQNLSVLGFFPLQEKSVYFILGFGIITVIVALNIGAETWILQVEWRKKSISFTNLFYAFWYHLKSALTEDLVFRGALLYILIKRIGARWAIAISSLLFGVYHWFSYGIIGERAILLIYILLITGLTGWVWAYSLYRTKSMMIGLGLHLGYNLVMSCFYQSEPFGELLFVQVSKVSLSEWGGFCYSMFRGLFPPLATFLVLKLVFTTRRFSSKETV